MCLWQFCGNLWQREEKCGKGCGNVAILLYICVNKKRLIILVIKHLTFLPQLPQLNCHKMGSLNFKYNFFPKNKEFWHEKDNFSYKHRNISIIFPNFAVFLITEI